MERSRWIVAVTGLVSLTLSGCGSSSGTAKQGAASAKVEVATKPDVVIFKFLEAVRTGVDTTASDMLTKLARQKTQEAGRQVAPPGSATASFKVGEVEMISDQEAHVASTWTDIGEDGKPHTDDIVWLLRHEPEGWRIQGMATVLFADLPPLILNFEDPADMDRKQQLAEQEIIRRRQAGQSAAEQARKPEAPATGVTLPPR